MCTLFAQVCLSKYFGKVWYRYFTFLNIFSFIFITIHCLLCIYLAVYIVHRKMCIYALLGCVSYFLINIKG